MKFLSVFIFLGFLLASELCAGYGTSDTGTTGSVFLKLAPGARPAAMGEAYAPLADDVYSVYFNPAGLNYISEGEISFMHSFWFQGINYSYLAYARPSDFARGSLGAAVTYLNYGSISRITDAGERKGDFTPYDLAVALSYARTLYGVDTGLTLKYIHQKIYDKQGSALAVDFGLRGRMLDDKLDLGFSFANLGSEMELDKNSHKLPFLMRLGAGYHLTENLSGAVQMNIPNDNDAGIHIGSEYTFGVISGVPVSVRAGYKTNSALDGLSEFSFGFGVSRDNIIFDYAASPYGKLGLAHRISLSFKGF